MRGFATAVLLMPLNLRDANNYSQTEYYIALKRRYSPGMNSTGRAVSF